MVRKEVAPLKEICLKLVSNRVWNFGDRYHSCIALKLAPSAQTTKRVLSCLPRTLLQNIYDNLLSHEFKLYNETTWKVAKSTSKLERVKVCGEFKLHKTKILYFILLILGFDERSTRIQFSCVIEKELSFLSKFGNNINSLSFQDPNLPWLPKPEWVIPSNFRIILQSAGNIQELNLEGVKYSDQFFKVIGEECNQLKVLKGVEVDCGNIVLNSNGRNNLGVATPDSFKNLLFKSNNQRNMCCNSLQSVHLIILDIPRAANSQIYCNAISFFVNNLPNLKSLGYQNFNPYLQSLRLNEIPETDIEEMDVKDITCDLASILNVFCPKVKSMGVSIADIEVLYQLSKFNFLEDLSIICFHDLYIEQTLTKLVSIQWPILRKLTVLVDDDETDINVDITSLALHFPMLSELSITVSSYEWDRKTHFRCLEKLQIHLIYCSTSWFESFANTISHLDVTGISHEPWNADGCQIFLRVPFPCLEYLDIVHLEFDFEFYTSVLKTLPKLQICKMYMGYGSDSSQYDQELLSQFLKENNIECETRKRAREIYW